jgi:hypothetical protein
VVVVVVVVHGHDLIPRSLKVCVYGGTKEKRDELPVSSPSLQTGLLPSCVQ